MSVINQMLVDLERRRASGEERTHIPDHVRALPGEPASMRSPQLWIVAVVITAIVVVTGAWWWMSSRAAPASVVKGVAMPAPATPKPEQAVVALSHEAVESIAQRMSFELANVPEPVAADTRVAATTVLSSREPVPTTVVPRGAALPAASRIADNATATKPPPRAVVTPAPPPPADISKRVRELTPRQRAETEYAKGASALHEGRSADALMAFEAALQADSTFHKARQALVGVLLESRRQAEASQALQEGLNISPAQSGFAMALARLQMERGELDAGVQTLARSLEFAAGNPDYIAFYGGLLQRQQKHAEAVEQFSRALNQRGNVGVWLLGLGVSLEALGRGSEAQEAYRRAKATGNLSPDLRAFADQRLR